MAVAPITSPSLDQFHASPGRGRVIYKKCFSKQSALLSPTLPASCKNQGQQLGRVPRNASFRKDILHPFCHLRFYRLVSTTTVRHKIGRNEFQSFTSPDAPAGQAKRYARLYTALEGCVLFFQPRLSHAARSTASIYRALTVEITFCVVQAPPDRSADLTNL